MDKKLQEMLAKFEKYFKDLSIFNSGTEKILNETGGQGIYDVKTFDLSKARSDKVVNFTGDRTRALTYNGNALIKIRFNNLKNPQIVLKKNVTYMGPFTKLYITNSAVTGGVLKLAVGTRGMFKIEGNEEHIPVIKDLQSADASGNPTVWTPTSGYRFVITDILFSTDAQLSVEFQDGGTVFIKMYLAVDGGFVSNFKTPIPGKAVDSLLTIDTSGAGNVSVTVVGYEDD